MNLITYQNVVAFIGEVTQGVFPEADPSRELYKIVGPRGTFYAVTEVFQPLTVDSIPDYVEPDKYCYTPEDGFYLNPNYNEMDITYPPEFQQGYQQALLDLAEEIE